MATARQRQITEALAAEIRALAGRQNLKAFSLHKLTGIPKSTMAAIWNGQSVIDVDQLVSIAAALDVDAGQLLVDAIANARHEPGPDPGVHPDDAAIVDSSDKLTKRQRAQVKRSLSGESDTTDSNRMAHKRTSDESVRSSVRHPRTAG
jgi:transcriptional regulator with XRE-family HTH domain